MILVGLMLMNQVIRSLIGKAKVGGGDTNTAVKQFCCSEKEQADMATG